MMNKCHILVSVAVIYNNIIGVISQGCLPMDQSPGNPVGVDCRTTFFDLVTDPESNCICCGVGQIDDNPADECLFATPPTTVKRASGTLTCNENFDCCSCTSLVCDNCIALECIGDSSCIGVTDITLNDACANQGATIICGGDIACYRTVITGECIKGFSCNGDNSCGNSIFVFNQNLNVPTTINSLKLEFNGDVSVPESIIFAKNVDTISCSGDNSCPFSEFTIECITSGCGVQAGGDGSASSAKWKVTNANGIECAGDGSCSNTAYTIDCISTGCPITINGDGGAINSRWTVTNANRFVCSSENGCSSSRFVIDFIAPGTMIICSGSCISTRFITDTTLGVLCNGIIMPTPATITGGCEGAIFRLRNNLGGSIMCDSTSACKNAVFTGPTSLDEVTNVDQVICASQDSCERATFKVSPSGNNFKFMCGSIQSCRKASIFIETIFRTIESFSCDANDACRGAIVNIEGDRSNGLIISSITFGGIMSARNAVFNIESSGNIRLDNVRCSGEQSCMDTELRIDLLSNSNIISRLFVECAARRSCLRTQIIIMRRGTLIPASEIRSYNINIACNQGNACNNAFINSIPFTSF